MRLGPEVCNPCTEQDSNSHRTTVPVTSLKLGTHVLHDQPWRVDLQILALHAELFAIRAPPSLKYLPPGRKSASLRVTYYMPFCPHQRGVWVGSVRAWKTHSRGAATKNLGLDDVLVGCDGNGRHESSWEAKPVSY